MTDAEYAAFRPTFPFENYDPNGDYPEMFDFCDRVEVGNVEAVANWLYPILKPQTVIDIGCATGLYLAPLKKRYGCEVFGIDGGRAEDGAGRHIAPEEFRRVDLRFPWASPKRYDLAICMEVAEHLPEYYADNLVDIVTLAGNSVLWSAAVPGQGGTYHVNERNYEYWEEKFFSRGFKLHEKHEEWRVAVQQLEVPPWSGWFRNHSRLFQRVTA